MTIILIIGIIFILWFLFKNWKQIKMGNLVLITGGVKTGKSTLSVWLTLNKYKLQLLKWKIYNWVMKLFKGKKHKETEKPLLYSNVPLKCDYVELTEDLLLRKKRFRYKSVVYIQEASLVADSMTFKDMEFNERISYFNKLIGHETKGGYLIYDTQSCADLHHGVKKNLNSYIYIHHLIKWVPFILIMRVTERAYSYDNATIQTNDGDIEDKLKTIIISKGTWKKFDCYTYSAMTDDLEVEENIVNGKKLKNLKTTKILTFKEKKENGKKI